MKNKYYKILELDKIILMLLEEFRLESNILDYQDIDNIVLSNDIDDIKVMLDETDEASVIIQRMGRFELSFTKDILMYVKRANKSVMLSIDELLELGRYLDSVKNLIIYANNLKSYDISSIIFQSYVANLSYSKALNLRIKEVISPFGEILDTASIELRQIRKQITDTEKNINSKLNEIVSKNSSKLTQALVTIRNDRFVIPVKNDFKNSIKGLIHDTSSSGETVYIEPLIILEMNNKLNSLREEEKKEINRLLWELSSMVCDYQDDIEISYQILKKLDLIFSKANLSIKLNGTKPIVNENGIVDLKSCYHPLLNVPHIVKNNIRLGEEYQGIIITGPNTGGKTVLLKTIGLLSLMVKLGLLIPCAENSNIMIFDNVYADIGDEQSISQNLSTFSSHMKNVVQIMNEVTEKSLVILDELGSGTDPTEGASLAISIFDYLLNKKCLVVATSHYAELKIHAYESLNTVNASVEFNIETLKPTYKLLIGVPGASNALKISRMLGLPENIINNAERLANSNTSEINITLEKLIEKSNLLEKKLNEIRDKEYRINKKLDEIDNEKEKINKEKKEIIAKANEEADKIIKKAENEIKDLINDLKELKSKDIKVHEISDLSHRFNMLRENNSMHIAEKVYDLNKEIEVNDNVKIEKYNAYGKVIKIHKNKYEVQVGNATITVTKDDLELTNVVENNVPTPKKQLVITPRKTVSNRLDLRGMRYEDAEPLISNYIYDAYYAGLKSVSIIHGFGTGVIRELVQKKVKNNKLVKSYRYGGQNEGGQGATIIDFE